MMKMKRYMSRYDCGDLPDYSQHHLLCLGYVHAYIQAIFAPCQFKKVNFHCHSTMLLYKAAQHSSRKMPSDYKFLNADLMSISGPLFGNIV